MTVTIRPAVRADLPALHPVIERAYRGDSARIGWTHEADLLSDTRTDMPALQAIVADPAQVLLMMSEGGVPLGCVNVADRGGALAYMGMLCVEPARQAEGFGRQLIDAALVHARGAFGCDRIEMTVIDLRRELIAYYERHGWHQTGERRPFPVPVVPPLSMTVLARTLA